MFNAKSIKSVAIKMARLSNLFHMIFTLLICLCFLLLFERGFTPSDPHRLMITAVRPFRKPGKLFRKPGPRKLFFQKAETGLTFFSFFLSPSLSFLILRSLFLVLVLILGSPSLFPPRLGSLSTEQYLETLTLLQ